MAALTRHGSYHNTRRNGSFAGKSQAATVVLVTEEARKALETRLNTITTATVAWPNRPFTVPTTVTACWVVAQPIGWTQGEGRSIGASTTRLGMLRGVMTVDICRRAGQGLGGLYTVADAVRDLFVRAQLSVPASMSLTCYAPSGPGPVQIVDGVTIVRVKVPFEVWETIPN